jgi:cytochrome c oxidase subunit IV
MLRTRTYFLVFFVLIALTALTFALSFAPLGRLEAPVALGIATVKAGLVGAFFMHLAEHRKPYWIFLLVGVLLVVSLVALMVLDVEKRMPRREPASAPSATARPGLARPD